MPAGIRLGLGSERRQGFRCGITDRTVGIRLEGLELGDRHRRIRAKVAECLGGSQAVRVVLLIEPRIKTTTASGAAGEFGAIRPRATGIAPWNSDQPLLYAEIRAGVAATAGFPMSPTACTAIATEIFPRQ